jgi:alpha-N-arabinofuranosidase
MNHLILNADIEIGVIDRHIYGHFAEHLGRCIYGGFWVGEGSRIANVRGIRSDVVEALKSMGIPNLRWPGGCFADEYHWMDGIGPREQRPSMVNTHWGGVTENNHFGTHEFLDLCDQLACEPYICGNLGSGTVREMQQWVEYITSDAVCPMTDLRKANGRESPWPLTYFGVGNENWACGGSMRAEYYADEFRRYQTYLRNFGGNEIAKIACGPNRDDYEWTSILMERTRGFLSDLHMMKGLSLHYYTDYRRSATEFDERDWFAVMKGALYMDELITRHSAIMDQHDPSREVALVVDEWGTWYNPEPGTNPRFLYQQNSLRDALVAALHLHIFNAHNERVRMANIAQTVNVLQSVILTDEEKMILTPTYHVFEMFKVHQDATRLSVDLEVADYSFEDQVIPGVSASASRDGEGLVHLTLCHTNPNKPVDLVCDLRGLEFSSVAGRILTAERMTDHNTFDQPDRVRPVEYEGAMIGDEGLTVSLPAMSVVALELA